jgi:hypothetical protein
MGIGGMLVSVDSVPVKGSMLYETVMALFELGKTVEQVRVELAIGKLNVEKLYQQFVASQDKGHNV